MSEPVVETEGLTKRFGPVRALEDLTVEIPRATWGLLGPNGAGKTTLLRLLMGLTSPTSGSARVAGVDPEQAPVEVRERIGFAPERDAFVPGLSGARLVAYAGQLGGLPETAAVQRAHAVLDFVGLDEARYRDVSDYSQGMRQRTKIAAALVPDPDLVFLDEPTNGLDPEGREEMLDLVDDLARRHDVPILFSSHVLPEVETVCEGALVLDEGTPVANAPLEELTAARASTYRVRLRGDREAFRQRLAARGAQLEETTEGVLHVHAGDAEGTRPILEAAREADVQVRELAPAREGLQDALVTRLEEASR